MKLALSNSNVYRYASGDPNARGGAERSQWLLSQALVRSGWAVVVGVPGRMAEGDEIIIDGVRFRGMGQAPGYRHYLSAWSSFLATESPDWWYFKGADPLWGALLYVAKKKKVRGIFSAAFDTDVNPRVALSRRRHSWPLYAWGLTAVDRIFVQHRGQLSGLNARLRPKTGLLPAVVTLRDQVEPHVNRNGSVAWVAVLREPKRPDLLVEIARRNPDLRFVVCGGTSTHRTPQGYSEEMARRLSGLPNVDYRGHVDPSETLEVISNATVLLSTSDQEGFPNTFLEAWSAGTPVVTLRIDPDDIIKRRGLGFVSGTIDQAASDIRSLVASETTFDAVSSRARSYVREVHSDDAVSQVFDQAILGAR